jgi:hypothetical protein
MTDTPSTKPSSNLFGEVINELPKEVLKKWAVGIITFIVLTSIGVPFGKKTLSSIFSIDTNNHDVTVYAKLDSRVKPGETVELYPPSKRSVVSTDMEVEWDLPFDQITKRTIELQKIGKNTTGGLTREVLVQLPIGEKPIVAFVLR